MMLSRKLAEAVQRGVRHTPDRREVLDTHLTGEPPTAPFAGSLVGSNITAALGRISHRNV
jgi:hypothetical protein